MNTSSLAGSHVSTRPLLLAAGAALALLAALGVHQVVDRSDAAPASGPATAATFVSNGRGDAARQYVDTLVAMHQSALASASR